MTIPCPECGCSMIKDYTEDNIHYHCHGNHFNFSIKSPIRLISLDVKTPISQDNPRFVYDLDFFGKPGNIIFPRSFRTKKLLRSISKQGLRDFQDKVLSLRNFL